MKPSRIELIGDFLAIRWEDAAESVIPLEELRRACPCAQCAGESDLTGRIHRPVGTPSLTEQSFQVLSMDRIGGYALGIHWMDGHRTGIYTWTQLREMGRA